MTGIRGKYTDYMYVFMCVNKLGAFCVWETLQSFHIYHKQRMKETVP